MLVASFEGKTPIPLSADPLKSGYSLWTYRIESTIGASELAAGSRVALGLPTQVDVRGAIDFPSLGELVGVFIQRAVGASRVYVGRELTTDGALTLSFAAPTGEASCEVLLSLAEPGDDLLPVIFATDPGASAQALQPMTVPEPTVTASSGRTADAFAGTLPYASEIFGVYKPLAGWLGRANALRVGAVVSPAIRMLNYDAFIGEDARHLMLPPLSQVWQTMAQPAQGVLSPVGLVSLFRQYFFEFDTFLGTPVGHLWISPGGTVEVVESSTRKTLIEKTVEVDEETIHKTEEALTKQEDIADAVKEDNANNTKLGASATGGAKFAGIYHADASASFSVENTTKQSSEETHKHSRTQSAKVSSEIRRNFKTTFKTVTESTDTTSRRYVVQNTLNRLVNYELRRKMRKVGVQVQHIGTSLSWQTYMDEPGKALGMGELLHIVPAPDLTSIRKPEPPPPLVARTTQFSGAFPIRKVPGTQEPPQGNMEFVHHAFPEAPGITNHANDVHAVAWMEYAPTPPEEGYVLHEARLASITPGRAWVPHALPVNPGNSRFSAYALFFNSGDMSPIQLTFDLVWNPPMTNKAHERYAKEKEAYDAEVDAVQRKAYAQAVRDRVKLMRGVTPRRAEDLRKEERHAIYGYLVQQLKLFDDAHLGSELLRQIFDVDEMLYFVAPDYWRPGVAPAPVESAQGRYPVPAQATAAEIIADPLAGSAVTSTYSHTAKNNCLVRDSVNPDQLALAAEWRINYPIVEDGPSAPMGSSLGWLIQIDGDERRNQFLNAAWVKAVLPVRPGHELDALDWLEEANVEGQAGLSLPYPAQPGDPPDFQGKTVGQVLRLLAASLQASNTDIGNTLATETVFEKGFDPLEGGFRPAEAYQIFDQWVEVLPTDQVVAVEVQYSPVTGQQT